MFKPNDGEEPVKKEVVAISEKLQPAYLPTLLDNQQGHHDASQVEVKEGKIASIVEEEEKHGKARHAHLDDPGRAEWKGFPSGWDYYIGFWGGLVPENAFNGSALEDLLNAGALGLKSLLCPSGINGFLMTNASHIKSAHVGLVTGARILRILLCVLVSPVPRLDGSSLAIWLLRFLHVV
ncbi:unnamed protein product [Prunus armeniaca]|uniref:Allantoinase composite domain-containing protein n=1 Tax=Prunus armeniaca TaxID=36596 RepID=A0A6J5XVQ5_PRUAR|nr:unnamed protein product [Prunus armeniaca]